MATTGTPPDVTSSRWAPPWWAVFLIGFALWVATAGAVLLTGDPILLPTVILVGSFLVPVTAVVWYLDHDPSPALGPRRILAAFIIAGVVGVLGASLLEAALLEAGFQSNLAVGFVEELVKGVLIAFVAWGIHRFTVRDGMVLGAAVGFGFAALESSGYAFVALFVVHGHQISLSFTSLLTTELVRGVLAPFGHGLWSAFLGGAIFAAAARRGHLRVSWTVVGAYVLVSLLHAAFDSISGIVGYVVVTIVGLVPLVWMWRRAGRPGPLTSPATTERSL
jgi:RsiW-degrading membrane proteinase PrsW (M82 family)